MFVLNKSYTVKIINPKGGEIAVNNYWADDSTLVDLSLTEDILTISTKNKLGATMINIEGINGDILNIPIEIDNIDYSYVLKYGNNEITDSTLELIYNVENTIQSVEIIEKRWSNLYNRFLTSDDVASVPFTAEINYEQTSENFTASITSNIINFTMLSEFSETLIDLNITSADGSEHTISKLINVIPRDRLITKKYVDLNSDTNTIVDTSAEIVVSDLKTIITLNNISTSFEQYIIMGGDSAFIEEGPNEYFEFSLNGNILSLKPTQALTNGLTLHVNTNDGSGKIGIIEVYVKPAPLYCTYDGLIDLKVNETTDLKFKNVIGTLDYNISNCNTSIEYNRDTFEAIVSITPTSIMTQTVFTVTDNHIDKTTRSTDINLEFYKGLVLTLESTELKALSTPIKIKFINANGPLEVVAIDNIGNTVRTSTDYDINLYTNEVSKTHGYISVYPVIGAKIGLRAKDSTSYADIYFDVLPAVKDLSGWKAILPSSNFDNIAGNLSSLANYSDVKLKAGDLVGTQWLDKAKYGKYRLRKIKYKVSPPEEIIGDSNASLQWMLELQDTTSTLRIDIRDGFLLDNLGKIVDIESHWVENNIFETIDMVDSNIYFEDAQTPLITDLNHRISLTSISERNGIIIYNGVDGEEVTARLSIEPIAAFEFDTIEERPKMPLAKPGSCLDVKRLDPNAETGQFRIFPSATEDFSVNVICEFGKDANGNDDIWTVIPSTSLRNFAEAVGKFVSDDNTKIKGVSDGGIRPQFYPSDTNSSQHPSYLILETPFKIKEFSFKTRTVIPDDNSMGTFRIMTDISDVFNINGSIDNYAMSTRSNTILAYDDNIVKSNIAQTVIVPPDYSNYAATKNMPDGSITPEKAVDRIIISNAGAESGFSVAETFLEELRFKSIFSAENLANVPWKEIASKIDIPNTFVKLSTDHIFEIVLKESKVADLNEFINLETTNNYIISDNEDDLIDLNEFIKLENDITFIISEVESDSIEFKNADGSFIKTTIVGTDNHIPIISEVESDPIEFKNADGTFIKTTIVGTDTHIPIISEVESDPIEFKNAERSFIKTTVVGTDTHIPIISEVETNVLENFVNIKFEYVYHEEIISELADIELNISEFVELKADINQVISTRDTNIINLNFNGLSTEISNILNPKAVEVIELGEFINVFSDNTIENISFEQSEIMELAPKYFIDAYHPIVVAMTETNIMELNSSAKLIERDPLPFTVYQNETHALDGDIVSFGQTPVTDNIYDLFVPSQMITNEIVSFGNSSCEPVEVDYFVPSQMITNEIVSFGNSSCEPVEVDYFVPSQMITNEIVSFGLTPTISEVYDINIIEQENIDDISQFGNSPVIFHGGTVETDTNIFGEELRIESQVKSRIIALNDSSKLTSDTPYKNRTRIGQKIKSNVIGFCDDVSLLTNRNRISEQKFTKVIALEDNTRMYLPLILNNDFTIDINNVDLLQDKTIDVNLVNDTPSSDTISANYENFDSGNIVESSFNATTVKTIIL